jgi:SAM-dependent methyltransferase
MHARDRDSNTRGASAILKGEMHRYYEERLAADRLKRCYDLAPPRVEQYLHAEVDFVVEQLRPTDVVLDLGCGYGRTIHEFARAAAFVVGVDTSLDSLWMAREGLPPVRNCTVVGMDATRLGFAARSFERVVCIQNGISAFHVDQRELVREALRVLRLGGAAMFSTYSDRFWEHRLDWFERQAAAGLIGEIDRDRTHDGVIVCKDGFTSRTVRPDELHDVVADLDVKVDVEEVDGSSVFYLVKGILRREDAALLEGKNGRQDG